MISERSPAHTTMAAPALSNEALYVLKRFKKVPTRTAARAHTRRACLSEKPRPWPALGCGPGGPALAFNNVLNTVLVANF